ncbi:hypothetical protein [Actinomycetospora atypica]|uniref:SMI1/KNR4 family protein n=1 Tax=Actinomycetospora atypica TaxID=1290095 RepID=A0ABV9YKA4_9PSEU
MPSLEELVHRVLDGAPATPASAADRAVFAERAADVPAFVVDELLTLYALHDGLTDETGLGFHPCADPVIFEWWASGELWLSQRHLYTVRWTAEHGYSRGDAVDVLFSPDDAFASLTDLLAAALE